MMARKDKVVRELTDNERPRQTGRSGSCRC
jgi:hypothetical protein